MFRTDEEIFQEVIDMSLRFDCEDLPEIKELVIGFNQNISDEARALHKSAVIIDACCFDMDGYSWHLKEGGVTALNVTIPSNRDGAESAVRNLADVNAIVAQTPELMPIETPDDILKAKETGKVGIIFGAQSSEFVQHLDLDASVEVFRRAGLRVMQLCYSHRTYAADGCYTGANGGLTADGKRLIDAMEKHGVTVDLSHVGDRSAMDALAYVKKPAILSHSNPRARFHHPRNVPDEVVKMCAETGGVVGVSTYTVTLWDGKNFPTIDMVLDNIDYYVDLIGIDHVGIGTDSMITQGAYPRRDSVSISKSLRSVEGTSGLRFQSVAQGLGYRGMYVEGMQSMANFPNLIDGLLKRGYSEKDVRKIVGENWLRVFRETWL